MFLKSLRIITGSGEIIRDIPFRKGLNLIVDETPSSSGKTSTGNNVGKSTVLRLVNFCLGDDGKSIYEDPEFKAKPNSEIKAFLADKAVVVELVLVSDLDFPGAKTVTIRRSFIGSGPKKILEINQEKVQDFKKDFDPILKSSILGSSQTKPTFKQVIARNIRVDKNRLEKVVRVLDGNTKPEEYEAVFFHWFGLPTDLHQRKQELSRLKATESNFQKRLQKEGMLPEIVQKLRIVSSELASWNKKRLTLMADEEFVAALDSLTKIRGELGTIATQYEASKTRLDLILESKAELEKEVSMVDLNAVAELYQVAKALIPNLQSTYEQALSFHNDLLSKKIKYITKDLPAIERTCLLLQERMEALKAAEKEHSAVLQNANLPAHIDEIFENIAKYSELKGNLEEQKRLWETSNDSLKKVQNELSDIENVIQGSENLLQERIEQFNEHFRPLCEQLYGESYLLAPDKQVGAYDLQLSNLKGNPSSGKKKAVIAAFDLAYIKFADEVGIPCLHFVMHDRLEGIHDNQLETIFKAVEDLNGQFVLPILRDKIPAGVDVTKYEVLSLSQKDKLFKQ